MMKGLNLIQIICIAMRALLGFVIEWMRCFGRALRREKGREDRGEIGGGNGIKRMRRKDMMIRGVPRVTRVAGDGACVRARV